MKRPWGIVHEDVSRRKWELGQNIIPTTWGADWDYYSAADRCCHTLYPYPCWLQEASIVTLPLLSVAATYQINITSYLCRERRKINVWKIMCELVMETSHISTIWSCGINMWLVKGLHIMTRGAYLILTLKDAISCISNCQTQICSGFSNTAIKI